MTWINCSRLPRIMREYAETYNQLPPPVRDMLDTIFSVPVERLPADGSICIVAAPQKIIKARFVHQGRKLDVIVPPTYDRRIDDVIASRITPLLEENGHRLTPVGLPKKYVAARGGLGRYGRNNILYIDGMGSFARLASFHTDLPSGIRPLHAPRLHPSCDTCQRCVGACPSGALQGGGIMDAYRCITFHNESLDPFPSWVDPSWMTCIIGCMHCQEVCPLNRTYLGHVRKVPFTEEETSTILAGEKEEATPLLEEKLRDIGLLDEFSLLSRNLSVLIANKSAQASQGKFFIPLHTRMER